MKTALLAIGLASAALLAAGCARDHATTRPSMARKKVTGRDLGRPPASQAARSLS